MPIFDEPQPIDALSGYFYPGELEQMLKEALQMPFNEDDPLAVLNAPIPDFNQPMMGGAGYYPNAVVAAAPSEAVPSTPSTSRPHPADSLQMGALRIDGAPQLPRVAAVEIADAT